MIRVEIRGLDELRARFQKLQPVYNREMRNVIQAALLVFWEKVPSYPQQNPETSYIRTGTLGRTLGSSEKGGRSGGQPEIFEVNQRSGYVEGTFGTRLEYAPYVIDDQRQAWMHRGRWWTIRNIAERSSKKIEQLFTDFAKDMAEYIDGRRGG